MSLIVVILFVLNWSALVPGVSDFLFVLPFEHNSLLFSLVCLGKMIHKNTLIGIPDFFSIILGWLVVADRL